MIVESSNEPPDGVRWDPQLRQWIGEGGGDQLVEAGAQGPPGIQGPQGIQGPAGPAGPEGPQGIQGIQGIQGVQGVQGAKGDKGDTGNTGAAGADGTQILSGPGAPSTPLGANGDFYLDLASGGIQFYGPKASGAWPDPIELKAVTPGTGGGGGGGAPTFGLTQDFNTGTTLEDVNFVNDRGVLVVDNLKLRGSTGGVESVGYYDYDTQSNDCYAEADFYFPNALTGIYAGVIVRHNLTTPSTFYLFQTAGGGSFARLIKSIEGTDTQIGSDVAITFAGGTTHSMRIECEGSTIRCYVDGAEVIDTTDTSIVSGRFGGVKMFAPTNATDVQVDNFEVGVTSSLITEPFTSGTSAADADFTMVTGSLVIDSGKLKIGSLGITAFGYHDTDLATSNHYVQADCVVGASDSSCYWGLTARQNSDNDDYYIVWTQNNRSVVELLKCIGGSFTSLGTYTTGWTLDSTHTVRLDCNGSTIRVLLDGVARITANDSAITAGTRVGVRLVSLASTTAMQYDNFRADDVASSGGGGGGGSGTPVGVVWSDEFNTGGTFLLSDPSNTRTWRPKEDADLTQGYEDYAGQNWNINPYQDPAYNPFTYETEGDTTFLRITSRRRPAGLDGRTGEAWVSGYMLTDPAVRTFTYGYFETRIRFNVLGAGMFPAWWLYGTTNSNEIDIFEIFGGTDGQMYATIHSGGTGENVFNWNTTPTAWHVYGFDWQPSGLRWYLDGVLLHTYTGAKLSAFNTPMSLRHNYAMTPTSWSGVPDGGTPSPLYMDIDYTRYWTTKP